MNYLDISEDIRQLFLCSETLKQKVSIKKVYSKTEKELRDRVLKYVENIQGEILIFNEFLNNVSECNDEEDLKYFLESCTGGVNGNL